MVAAARGARACAALLLPALATVSATESQQRQGLAAGGVGAPGLGDVPLAGGRLQYLDGTSWSAMCVPTAAPVTNATCSFEPNVDFDVGNTTPTGLKTAASAQACCLECWNDPACAAAVFVKGSGANCYPKDASQLRKKASRPGRVACIRGTAPAPPPAKPSCQGGPIAATVPGDLLSDLERAGTIGDPLFELNFKDEAQQSLWMQDWAYTRSFALEGSSAAGALLVFDSIKMGARVYVDGALLGTAEVRAPPLADVFSRWAASPHRPALTRFRISSYATSSRWTERLAR